MNILRRINIVLGCIAAGLLFFEPSPFIAGASTGIALCIIIMWTLYFLVGDK